MVRFITAMLLLAAFQFANAADLVLITSKDKETQKDFSFITTFNGQGFFTSSDGQITYAVSPREASGKIEADLFELSHQGKKLLAKGAAVDSNEMTLIDYAVASESGLFFQKENISMRISAISETEARQLSSEAAERVKKRIYASGKAVTIVQTIPAEGLTTPPNQPKPRCCVSCGEVTVCADEVIMECGSCGGD